MEPRQRKVVPWVLLILGGLGLVTLLLICGAIYLLRDKSTRRQLAIRGFTSRIARNPGDAHAYYGRGVLKYGEGDYSGAEQDLVEAIRLLPYASKYHSAYGMDLVELKRYREARKELMLAVHYGPGDYSAYCHLSFLDRKEKMYVSAEVEARRAIERKPNDHQSWYNLGAAALLNHDYSLAENACLKAAQLDEPAKRGTSYYGMALYSEGHKSEAMKKWHEAERSSSDFERSLARNYLSKYSAGQPAGQPNTRPR